MAARSLATALSLAVIALAGAAPRVALADATPHEQALDLFQRGGEAYRAGKFPEAVKLLTQAYELEHDPTLLYNIARSYENLGDLDHAVATYEQYLRDAKDIKDRAGIEQHVAVMKKQIAEKAELSKERDEALKQSAKPTDKATPAPAGPAAPVARRAPSPAPWILAAVGVAGLGAGGGLGAVALSKNGDAAKAPSQKAASDLHDSAKSLALGSTVAFVAGGVLAGAGLTWGIVDLATRGPATPGAKADVKVTLGPASAGVRVDF